MLGGLPDWSSDDDQDFYDRIERDCVPRETADMDLGLILLTTLFRRVAETSEAEGESRASTSASGEEVE